MNGRTSSRTTSSIKRTVLLHLVAFFVVLLFTIYNLFGGFFKEWNLVYEDCFIKNQVIHFKLNNSLITPFFENGKAFSCESP